MGNRWADGQKSHRRPTWGGELAQHSEAHWFVHGGSAGGGSALGGKCGGRAGKQHALIWGDPREGMPWEVSRRHSSRPWRRKPRFL